MIFFGITVRRIGVFNPVYVGIFCIGLGFSLFIAGVFFLISLIRYKKTVLQFSN